MFDARAFKPPPDRIRHKPLPPTFITNFYKKPQTKQSSRFQKPGELVFEVYPAMNDLLLSGDKKLHTQLDTLIVNSFPLYFPRGSSFIKSIINNIKANKIKSEDIETIICLSDGNVVGCVQIAKERDNGLYPDKVDYRLVNLCRLKDIKYKTLGKLLLQIAIDHVRENYKDADRVLLNVRASNTKLQSYYASLGWINTHYFTSRGTSEPAYEMMYLLTND